MADERKVQLGFEVDASGAKKGFDQVKQDAKSMADSVTKSGQESAKGIDGIGAATENLNAKQSRLLESIKRSAVLATEGKAAYLEQKAAMAGVGDAASIYIAKIKAAEQGQTQLGMSAKATAAALRGVPAQFTDIITSLQGGQQPLTVLLQQGGQLKDMFGGVGAAAKALGGYILGLVNPLTVTIAAMAGLGVAIAKLESSDRVFASIETSLRVTGRASIATTAELKGLVYQLSLLPGMSKSSSEATVAEFAKAGKIGGSIFKDLNLLVADYAKAAGQDAPEAARQLAKSFSDPVAGAKQLDAMFNTLSASTLLAVEEMAKQNDIVGAQTLLLNELKKSLSGVAQEGMTPLQVATKEMGKAWKEMNHSLDASDGLRTANNAVVKLVEAFTWIINHSGQIASAIEQALPPTVRLGIAGLGAWANSGTPGRREFSGKITGAPDAGAGNALESEVKSALELGKAYQTAQSKMDDLRGTARVLSETMKNLSAAGRGNSEEYKKLKDQLAGVNEAIATAEKRALAGSNAGASEIANLRARIIAEQQYLKQLQERGLEADKLNDGERKALELQEQLKGKLDAKTRAHKEAELVEAQSLGRVQRQVSDTKELLEAQKQFTAVRDKENASIGAEIVKINEKAQAIEDEVAMYGLSRQAIDALAIARLEERKAVLLGFDGAEEAIALLEQEIEARKRLAKAIDAKDAKDTSAKAAQDAQREWKRAADEIERTLTDSLMRGFESGKSFAQNLRDTTVNMFKTMILRPTIQAIVSPVAGAITGSLYGSASSSGMNLNQGMNLFSMGKTLWDGFSTGFSGLASMAGGGISSLGSMLGSSTLGSFGAGMQGASLAPGLMGPTTAGASGAMGAGAAFAKSIPIIGWIMAGMMQNASWYDQGWRPDNGTISNFGKVIGSPSLIPDKILRGLGVSGKMASILSGSALFSRLFGRKDPEVESFGIQGNLSDAGFTDATSYARIIEKGGLFRSDKKYPIFSDPDPQLFDTFNTGILGLIESTKGFAATLGLEANNINGYVKGMTLDLTDDAEKNAEIVANFFTDVANELSTKLLPTISDFAKGSEGAAEALQRLASEFAVTSAVSATLGKTAEDAFGAVGLASADARERLISLAGGIDALASGTAFFAQNFLSPERQIAPVIKSVDEALAPLGAAGIRTKDQFVALVDTLDLSTEAGAKAYASLINLAPAFLQIADYTKSIADTAASNVANARNVLADAYNRESSALKGTIEQFSNFGKSIREFRASLLTSDLSPLSSTQKTSVARDQFESTLGLTKSSDRTVAAEAMAALQGKTETYLQSLQESSATKWDFERGFAKVRAGLDDAANTADKQVSVAQQQLDMLTLSVTGILDVKKEVISVREALDQYFGAGGTKDQTNTGMPEGATTGGIVDRQFADIAAYGAEKGPDAYYLIPGVNDYAAKLAAAASSQAQSAALGVVQSLDETFEAMWGMTQDAFKQIQEKYGLQSLPGFAVGTNFLPKDMPIMAHAGERIVPAADNRALIQALQGGGNSANVERVLLWVVEALQNISAETKSSAQSGSKLARLIERAMPEGDAFATREVTA